MTPQASGSKSTKFFMSTMLLANTFTCLPSTSRTASFTPALSSSLARSRVRVSPASAMISPVRGSATGRARVRPDRRVHRAIFLLNL